MKSMIRNITDIFHWCKKLFGRVLPGKETRKIVILGDKYSGKTELWCQLQGKKNETPGGGTSQEIVESFELGKNPSTGNRVYVETTKDVGGGSRWVPDYDCMIEGDGIFVYYLIDLTRIDDNDIISDTRDRLRTIISIIEKKKLKYCGVRILATFCDKYNGTKKQAEYDLKNKIFSKKIFGFNSNPPIQVICTLDKCDIESIKQQILKTIER